MTLKFDADSDFSRVQADYAKLEKANLRLIEQNDKLRKASRAASQSQKRASDQSIASAIKGVAALGLVSKAAGFAGSAYKKWKEDIRAVGKEHTEFQQKLVAELLGIGDVGKLSKVKDFVGSQKFATRAEAFAAFKGVGGGGPNLGFARRSKIAGAVSGLAPLIGEQELTIQGELAGRLGSIAPKKSAGDIADLTLKLSQGAGKDAAKLRSPATLGAVRSLTQRGFSIEEALGIVQTAIQKDIRPATIDSIAGKAGDRERFIRAVSDGTFARDKKGGLGLSELDAGKLGRLGSANIGSAVQSFRAVQVGDSIARKRLTLEESRIGRTQIIQQSLDVARDRKLTQLEESQGTRANRRDQRFEIGLIGQGGFQKMVRRRDKDAAELTDFILGTDIAAGALGSETTQQRKIDVRRAEVEEQFIEQGPNRAPIRVEVTNRRGPAIDANNEGR